MADWPVGSGVLDALGEEIRRIEDGELALSTPLGEDENLKDACLSIFAGTFRTALNVRVAAFSQTAKERVVAAAFGGDTNDFLGEIVDLFAEICDVWPEVVGPVYGGSELDFHEFRVELVPRFLEAWAGWSLDVGPEAYGKVVDKVAREYRAAIERAVSRDA